MPRDPARIDIIIEELRNCWKKDPDMRLGQLIEVVVLLNGGRSDSIFYFEDDRMLMGLQALNKEENSEFSQSTKR